ncbi:hypothetical protein [Teredinibacter turnerae]|uniref:hypothetical protein n=1 Tax=Teredinibacter turnerae TaxID=2426 RepID=UPI0003708066|nr:hypothetical protein [Teredinibacter turnerae]
MSDIFDFFNSIVNLILGGLSLLVFVGISFMVLSNTVEALFKNPVSTIIYGMGFISLFIVGFGIPLYAEMNFKKTDVFVTVIIWIGSWWLAYKVSTIFFFIAGKFDKEESNREE